MYTLWKDVGNSGSRGSCRTWLWIPGEGGRGGGGKGERENLDCERSVLERAPQPAIRSIYSSSDHASASTVELECYIQE